MRMYKCLLGVISWKCWGHCAPNSKKGYIREGFRKKNNFLRMFWTYLVCLIAALAGHPC